MTCIKKITTESTNVCKTSTAAKELRKVSYSVPYRRRRARSSTQTPTRQPEQRGAASPLPASPASGPHSSPWKPAFHALSTPCFRAAGLRWPRYACCTFTRLRKSVFITLFKMFFSMKCHENCAH